MGLVTIASFDLINSNFVPEEAYFPPVLTVLGVKNEVVELLKQYNGWNKKMYFLLYFTLLVILVLGVILSTVFIVFDLTVPLVIGAGISFILLVALTPVGCLNHIFNYNTEKLLLEFCAQRKICFTLFN